MVGLELEAILPKLKNNSGKDVRQFLKVYFGVFISHFFYVVVNICHLYYNAVRRFYALDYTEQDFSDSASRDAEKKATKGFFFHSK